MGWLVMPSNRPLRKIKVSSHELNQVQDAIRETLLPITVNPILNGKLVQHVPLGVGQNTISHGLGRNFITWFAGNFSATCAVYNLASPDVSKYIVVNASAVCVADFLVL